MLAGWIAVSAGCGAGISTIPYTAQPDRISNPTATLKALILANTVQGCVSEPSYTEAMLVVKFVCNGGTGNNVLRFDRIASIELQQSGEWFRVFVHHRGGAEDFAWASKSLDDVQRIEDAIIAISRGAKPDEAPAAPASSTI